HERQLAHAQRVIASTPGLTGRVSAQDLAAQNAEVDTRDLATRALADRSWVYGHVIVDEAQELTPMQWRMLARRCPTRSMTVVGDIAQTSAPLSTTTWVDRLTALRTAPRQEELTICYRSPRELVEAVEPLLRQLRPDARAIDAVRRSGTQPVLADGDLDESEQITDWARSDRAGQRAIISPRPESVLAALTASGTSASDDDLREDLVVLPPMAAKGLEFDHVLVHDPDRIEAEHGVATLYVALTRATGTLAVAQRGSIERDLGPAWELRRLGRGALRGYGRWLRPAVVVHVADDSRSAVADDSRPARRTRYTSVICRHDQREKRDRCRRSPAGSPRREEVQLPPGCPGVAGDRRNARGALPRRGADPLGRVRRRRCLLRDLRLPDHHPPAGIPPDPR